MSCLEVYGVKEDGTIEHVADARNAWQGAMLVWTKLGEKYLGKAGHTAMFTEEGAEKVWALAKDPRLSDSEWAIMKMTFDNCIVPVGQMEWCARACDETMLGHYGPEMGKLFRKMIQDGYQGVCFNQTSVNGNPWMTALTEEEAAKEENKDYEGYRPYNIKTDTKHWLFDRASRGQ